MVTAGSASLIPYSANNGIMPARRLGSAASLAMFQVGVELSTAQPAQCYPRVNAAPKAFLMFGTKSAGDNTLPAMVSKWYNHGCETSLLRSSVMRASRGQAPWACRVAISRLTLVASVRMESSRCSWGPLTRPRLRGFIPGSSSSSLSPCSATLGAGGPGPVAPLTPRCQDSSAAALARSRNSSA